MISFLRTALLLLLLTPGAAAADPWGDAARYRFEYRVDLSALPTAHGQRLQVWVPYPATTDDQRIVSAAIESPWPYTVTHDALGNQMLHLEGRGAPPAPLVMRFVVDRTPSDGIPAAAAAAGTPLDPARYKAPAKLVPLEGRVREIAEEQSRGLTNDQARVRAFYDYVVRTMRYDKTGDGWGRGDAVWACTNQRGNCTDFHSLFLGLALSQGIPARFVIGFPIPPAGDAGEIAGYHCWAEYFSPLRGWVPLDSSEAKKSGRPDAYFGHLPNDRIQFTVGRDLTLAPPQAGPPLNFFIYPYAEIDGTPADLKAQFRFERLPEAVAAR